ncbi:MAG: UDP-N-acetylenolpyruvoylglucosamine reductase [Flavobacteriales bacterium]|nr:UDP-N-acetylenolpyruvoylglucosamine reductase [Flavobacteriales bacterium]
MLNFKENYCLKRYNTFGVEAKAKFFISFKSTAELKNIIESEIYINNKNFILGQGSNILITKDFDGLIIHNKITGIRILEENKNNILVEVGAGVNWHEFVTWSVEKELSGIENLALIPGTVGASPVQNIGAYGMEVKNSITKVHAFEIQKGKNKIFSNKECKFKYRDSIFKNKLKDKIIITKVEFKLLKNAINNTSYGNILEELNALNIKPSPKNISQAVINIRNRKLPNPTELGNSGSFFKNPIVSSIKFKNLKRKFPQIVGYKISESETKIAAGWLIENAGLKGYRQGDAGVHKNQALVLVNYGTASGKDIMHLAQKVQNIIIKKYGVHIIPEVNII